MFAFVRRLGIVAAVLLGLPALLGAVLVAALNTDPGRRLAERAVARVSDGRVVLTGLAGRFPDALRLARLELRDDDGAWLSVGHAELDWRPTRLLEGEARIGRLAAADVAIFRLPRRRTAAPDTDDSIPVPVVVETLRIDRLSIATPVAAVMSADASGRLDSLVSGTADLSLRRLDGAGTYRLTARVDATSLSATLAAEEPARGVLAALADLPDVGAVSLHASAEGPWAALLSHLALTAGGIAASADGRLDVPGKTVDFDVAARAPSMAPRPDVSWQSARIEAHLHGAWTAPHAQGTAEVERLAAAGVSTERLSATLAGDLGKLTVDATAGQVRIPGPAPDLFAATPVTLRAEARLDDPARPVMFSLTHPLLFVTGQARATEPLSARAHLDLPDLAPLAALGAPPLAGHAALDLTAAIADGAPTLNADGVVAVTAGPAPLPALLGPTAHIAATATLRGDAVALSRLQVEGKSVSLAAHGSVGEVLDVAWQASLPDLSVLAATVQGDMTAHGGLQGAPDTPNGTIAAEGRLAGAPLTLDATAARSADGAITLGIARADWRSLHADGALTLAPAADLPAGRIALRVDRLADLSAIVGQPIGGALDAEVSAQGPDVRLRATARNATLAGAAAIAAATLDLRVRDPLAERNLDGSLDLAGLSVFGLGGTARLEVRGPPAALALQLRTTLAGLGDAPLVASAAARLDAPGRGIAVATLQADWHGETLRLLAPARVAFADGVRFERAKLGLRDAVLDMSGKVAPTLDLTATLRDLPADLVSVLRPHLHPAGVVQAEARLTGAPDRPDGRLHLAATGLRLRDGPGTALPAATVIADATLAGGAARLTARLTAGRTELSLGGSAPLHRDGAFDLRVSGSADLAMFDPLLAAAGRRLRGQATLDATLTGSLAAPRAGGTLLLANGDAQDNGQGVHISDIEALVEGSGDRLRLAHLTGRSGQGTISAAGSLGLAGGLPLDLTITGRRARPIASDLLTADLDLDLALRGDVLGRLALGGTITVERADISVPERLPDKVAVLQVRRPGLTPPPAAAPPLGLAVTLIAPGKVFVRGRGLDAELQGRIALAGSTDAPNPDGRFTLRRGTFNLAGQTLRFTSGDIGFDGTGFDPTLHMVATSNTAAVAATLTVTGTASAPTFTLTSTPDLPQDEILSQLLFRQTEGSLNGLQLAQSAAALAQISGIGAGFDPLETIRQRLGLDRLAVGSAPTGTGATLEAGRYVAPGIYVGARQGTAGAGTQATVQIDLTRGLKLQATAGTGGTQSATGATSTDDPSGSSIGLSYQFDY
jgi:translocation and assembly module TamB